MVFSRLLLLQERWLCCRIAITADSVKTSAHSFLLYFNQLLECYWTSLCHSLQLLYLIEANCFYIFRSNGGKVVSFREIKKDVKALNWTDYPRTDKKPNAMLKKILGTRSYIQLSVRPIVRRSREIISQFEEPFYRTNNPMGYAVLAGVILGCFIFLLLSGRSLFQPLH